MTDHLLWEDFYSGNVAFHVEHFGTAVTAQQVPTVDTNSAPVFIRIVLFSPSCCFAAFVYISIGEQRVCITALLDQRGKGGGSVSGRGRGGGTGTVQSRTRCIGLGFCFDAVVKTFDGILACRYESKGAVLWTAHLERKTNLLNILKGPAVLYLSKLLITSFFHTSYM